MTIELLKERFFKSSFKLDIDLYITNNNKDIQDKIIPNLLVYRQELLKSGLIYMGVLELNKTRTDDKELNILTLKKLTQVLEETDIFDIEVIYSQRISQTRFMQYYIIHGAKLTNKQQDIFNIYFVDKQSLKITSVMLKY